MIPIARADVRRSAIAMLLPVAIICVVLVSSTAGVGLGRPLAAMFDGAFGSWYAFGSGTLVRATPLMLTGLAVAIAFRAGVFNIGAEGQFIVGAAAAAALALALPPLPSLVVVPCVLVVAAAAGASWASVAAVLRVRFHVLEVISTIMLNFIAVYLVSYLVRGPLQEPTHVFPQTPSLAAAAQLPKFSPTSRLHLGFAIAVAACVVGWWMLSRTAAGYRLRAVGANPFAALSAGRVNVARVTVGAFLVSGALAGLAGGVEVSGVTYALYENISPGYGYTAIAVALLARLNPAGVIATGILFGALEAGASAMQRDAGVPSVVVSVIEAGAILALVAVERVRASASATASE